MRNFGSHIGQALLADEIVGVNFGENWISIDPDADYDETVAQVEEVVDGYPGLFHDVQTYLNERIEEVLTGSSDAIVVRIFGQDLKCSAPRRDEVEAAPRRGSRASSRCMSSSRWTCRRSRSRSTSAAAQRYGLKPGDVRRAAATLMAGEEVGDIFRDGKAYDVQRLEHARRRATA